MTPEQMRRLQYVHHWAGNGSDSASLDSVAASAPAEGGRFTELSEDERWRACLEVPFGPDTIHGMCGRR